MANQKQETKRVNIAPYIIVPLLIILLTFGGLFLYVYSKRDVARIVVDFPITERMIYLEIKNMERAGVKPQTNSTATEIQEFYSTARTKAITNLTDFFVVLQKAKDTNQYDIPNEQIEQRIKDVISISQLNTLDEYLTEGEVSESEFRTQVRNQLVYEKMTEPLRAGVGQPTTSELEEYFNTIKDQLVVPETVDYEVIVVPDEKTRNKVLEELTKGKGNNFAEVAKKYSTDLASRENGGKMIAVPKESITEVEVSNALFPPTPTFPLKLEQGIIQPIVTQKSGEYIIRLNKRNPAQQSTLYGTISLYNSETKKYEKVEIKPQVVSMWQSSKGDSVVSAYVKRLSDYYESRIYDRVKGNMPWASLEKFFSSIFGNSLWNNIMGVEDK
ncbi:MAG TPA: peptidyl-prolyl cis-trans isomerase [Caldisericia bacterium]|nr:MAG: Peptidyl-prolyl cis-trans isomerase D [bacterium ADurb.Bin132]HNY61403.1 peptidyl-prolyl cis-trans isomerase [Caldisericia bacterium]HOC79780.1 peptidyl-prolyl cis-trans isomerase [Caldisericia bacterium]HOG70406.1 peptidyl-prolyl cis-trans isomerase [Caldisericia bacterium]HQL68365.1 peptidyl-prolyl cis-trans isomerase [Caldisericia bacterium]